MPRLSPGFPVVLVGALLAGACSHASEPLAPALADGSQSVEAQLGDTVRIVLVVTNSSRETVRVGMQSCNGDFVLVDRLGRVFYPAEYWPCRFALLAPQPLAPGASRRLPVFTTGLVVPEGSQQAPAMLPAGTYRVQSTVRVFEGDDRAIVVRPVPSAVTFRAP
jgi:hypothetical protein